MVVPVEDMPFLEDGTPVDIILNPTGVPGRMNLGQVLETHLGWAATRLGFYAVTPVFDGAKEAEIESELARAWMMDRAWDEIGQRAWDWLSQDEYDPETLEDDDEVRQLYLEQWLGEKNYDIYELISNYTYARKAVMDEWLREKGYDPAEVESLPEFQFDSEKRKAQNDRAVVVGLRLWLETEGVDVSKLADDELRDLAMKHTIVTNHPAPIIGTQVLRDGKTGETYDRPVTVGVMTMLKLHHLVEDKVHARSTGPYSLVSQQPLGGKAQFGGQRFGEMEVWALEAYGAAYTLQEMLTVKSDDVQGRVKTYEAIVKGEPIEDPSIPASFRVLVKELQSLGLAVEAITDTGEVIRFGKDENRSRPASPSTGLLGIGNYGKY